MLDPRHDAARAWQPEYASLIKLSTVQDSTTGRDSLHVVVLPESTNHTKIIYMFSPRLQLRSTQALSLVVSTSIRGLGLGTRSEDGKKGWGQPFDTLQGGSPWDYQRYNMYIGFPGGREGNPVAPFPTNRAVKLMFSLGNCATVFGDTPLCCLDIRIPPNNTGKEQYIDIISAEVLDSVPDDPYAEKIAAFDAYVRNYKPDYSDSSKHLLPPEGDRFDTPFAVVRDGQAAADIVLPNENTHTVVLETAAKAFQQHVKMLTGVELAITNEWGILEKKTGKNKIVLGKRGLPKAHAFVDLPAKYSVPLEKMSGTDGFAVVQGESPDTLHIFGVTDKGTMNGVFTMLENNTDLIWARPHKEFGTIYTERKDLDFVWGNDVVSVPASPGRGWNGYNDLEWMSHNRCNIFNGGMGGDIAWMNKKKGAYGVRSIRHLSGHNPAMFLKDAGNPLVKAHDEAGKALEGYTQPCHTNPDTLETFKRNLLKCARLAPDNTDRIYIEIDDSWFFCRCSDCVAPITNADGTVLTQYDENFRSTQYWLFMNKVAAALVAEFPKMGIDALAYFGSLPPPACNIHPALSVEWAPYPQSNRKTPLFHPENRILLRYLDSWTKKVPRSRLLMYGYYGLGMQFPCPLADVMAWDFREITAKTVGPTTEYFSWGDIDKGYKPSASYWDYSAMEFWVMTRLYWDPWQDVERLRKYYIARAFREAAPDIERFYGRIRETWLKSFSRSSISGRNDAADVIKANNLEDELAGYLDAAAAKVQHPKSAELVRRLRARFEESRSIEEKK